MAADKNIKMYRGDEYKFQFNVKDQNGEVVDITGGTVIFTAKYKEEDADADAVMQYKTTDAGARVVVTDAANGIGTVEFNPADTSALPAQRILLEHDLKYITSTGKPYTLIRGVLEVLPNVTISNA